MTRIIRFSRVELVFLAMLVGGLLLAFPVGSSGATRSRAVVASASSPRLIAYVANEDSGTVTPINLATNTPGPAIAGFDGPLGVAATPDGTTVYVTDHFLLTPFDGGVTPINVATNTLIGAPIPVDRGPSAIAITPDGKTAYVTSLDQNSVTPIDLATNTPNPRIPVGSVPSGVAFTPDGKTAYVTNFLSDSVTPIIVATRMPGPAIPVGSGPWGIAITPDGKTAYVANRFSDTVTPIDVATNTPGLRITVVGGPTGVAITPDGKTAYVTNFFGDSVTPITVATNAAGTPIPVGAAPLEIAITPDGKTAYVTNSNADSVTPITLATNTPGTPIPVGRPSGIAIAAAAAPNYAPDPDLETNPAPFYFTNGPCQFSWVSDASHSPTHALKISSTTSTLCRWLTETRAIGATPGATYDVSGWLKTLGTAAVAHFSINFWDKTETYIPATVDAPQTIHGPQDWVRLSLHVTAPAKAAFLRIELRLNGPGTLWGDDLAVTPVGAAPLLPPPPVSTNAPVASGLPQLGQTLATTTGGWTDQPTRFDYQWLACTDSSSASTCTPISGAATATYILRAEPGRWIRARVRATGLGGTAEALSNALGPVVEAPAISGNLARDASVELEPSPYYFTNGACSFNWANDASHSPTHALKISSTTSTLCRWLTETRSLVATPGQTYDIAAWLKTLGTAAVAHLSVNFWDKAETYLPATIDAPQTIHGPQDWTQLALRVTAPANAAFLRVEFRLNGPGTLWADDLTITNPLAPPPPPPTIIDLGPGFARHINDAGQVVGNTANALFSWTASGGVVTFDGPRDVVYRGVSILGINSSGQVIGNGGVDDLLHHAFLWTANGGFVLLGSLPHSFPAGSSYASAINDSGQVVGGSNPLGSSHAFSWTAAGGMVDLGTLGGDFSLAMAVNNSGQVVGDSFTSSPGGPHAFSWTAKGGLIDLGTFGGTTSEGFAINDNGQVVGWSHTAGDAESHAFSWTRESGMIDLGTLGGTSSVANRVTASGQVVGWSTTSGGAATHAFSWTRESGMIDLGTLGGTTSLPTAVNNDGQVVGWSYTSGDAAMHAFSWTRKSGMVDLGTLGGATSWANDLNNNGQIAGWSATSGNGTHAVIWQP